MAKQNQSNLTHIKVEHKVTKQKQVVTREELNELNSRSRNWVVKGRTTAPSEGVPPSVSTNMTAAPKAEAKPDSDKK